MSSKFNMQVDFHLRKRVPSLIANSEVDFRLYGRHLEKNRHDLI